MASAPLRRWASRSARRQQALSTRAVTIPLWQHGFVALAIGPFLWRAAGGALAARFAIAMTTSATAQAALIGLLCRRLGGVEPAPADALTLVRATAGATLLALRASSIRGSPAFARGVAFALLVAAVATDWLDGPLARRKGSSRLGTVLDIEADSLLTLGAAVAGAAWGGLPPVVLLAPVLRYRDPLLALRRGEEPGGGGPWWCRASGAAQMALFLTALRPCTHQRSRWRRSAAFAVVLVQVTTQLIDGRRRNPPLQPRPATAGTLAPR